MYDHMYQRGYVENVPGAPMCGCVEQMPTGEFAYVLSCRNIDFLFHCTYWLCCYFPVTHSDCTQVDLTETIEVTYKAEADTNTFTSKLVYVHVDYNACQGINSRNNDLYAGRLYYHTREM